MANEKYGVIRTDLMSGTDVAADLVSLKYFEGDEPAAIENGCVVKLEGLLEGEREIRKAVAPAADTPMEEIAIVANPEVMYDERKRNLDQYINEAGRATRGYIPRSRNIYSVTAEALTIAEGVTPEKGYVVELTAGVKPSVVASASGSATKLGEIIAVEQAGRYTYYVIQLA